MENRFSKLNSEPIPLGEGKDPGSEFIGHMFSEVEIKEPLPICSVCQKESVCWLTDTTKGTVIEIFDKCRGCLLGFPKHPIPPKKQIVIGE